MIEPIPVHTEGSKSELKWLRQKDTEGDPGLQPSLSTVHNMKPPKSFNGWSNGGQLTSSNEMGTCCGFQAK